jgi:3-hydroxyacyl-CoA dehydrogenase/enoyl-CoA hydratase/3-hydroxybutyryl-CoA epimerase
MKSFTLEIIEGNIALLTFDVADKQVNIFGAEIIAELESMLQNLKIRNDLQALIFLSGKDEHFCAGADMNILANLHNPDIGYQLSRKGQQIFSLFTQLPFPAIAVINGICVGGGTELALSCSYRLASDHPRTKIALPEVTIGIIPGWGGTQRLPRLIGLQRSLDFILTGRQLNAQHAYQLGLVDKIISHNTLLPETIAFVKAVIDGENVLRDSYRSKRLLLDRLPFGKKILYIKAERTIFKHTRGNYPAPVTALAAMRSGLKKSLKEGLEIEASYLKQMVGSPVSKHLIQIFFWREAVKKESGAEMLDMQPEAVSRAAVVGSGVMGNSIAQLLATHGIFTCLKGNRAPSLRKAEQQIVSRFGKNSDNITYTLSYDGFQEFPFVIESISEKLPAKQQLLRELEMQVTNDTIIASNTSSFRICDLAKSLQIPERFIGMHFFNPPGRTQLVEIIRGEATSDKTVVTTINLAKQLGKIPIMVRDRPGFLVNRILAPFLLEALIMLDEGMEQTTIDQELRKFGLPAGSFEMYDTVGIDIALAVAKNLANEWAESSFCITFLEKMVAAGYLGKKTGLGFYRYKKHKKKCNKKIRDFISVTGNRNIAGDELIPRLIYPMINESARCLEDQIVRQARDIDLAMILGIGFAPFRGGLLTYADTEGIQKIITLLEAFSQEYGPRFQPAGILYTLRDQRKCFYSDLPGL